MFLLVQEEENWKMHVNMYEDYIIFYNGRRGMNTKISTIQSMIIVDLDLLQGLYTLNRLPDAATR